MRHQFRVLVLPQETKIQLLEFRRPSPSADLVLTLKQEMVILATIREPSQVLPSPLRPQA